ncbi:trypsin-like peptidase domain-containing protein [Aeromicrobium sp. YIM 150415]|uniref:trypsin-like serine peptidase n=1 Tax=Aeromicrobium sp. YIM 150415 TaxID=2803912 RepID=UPI001965C0CB|nr:serine protease [Aeromicrobium sp. YIM 150415]MBM9465402.1 trypsin-like peptidase domain-containing protein [Aeromicrobium sp. YIM 150415]
MMIDYSQVTFAVGRQSATGIEPLGTAFAVGPRKLATAFHVTGARDDGLVIIMPRFKSIAEYQDTTDQQVRMLTVTIAAANPVRDLCVLELPENATLQFSYSLAGADLVPPGASIVTLGFPHLNFGRMILTQQRAHVGARVLIANESVKSKHIVLNTQAREGQSGGPVFDASMTQIVAVLIGSYAPGGGGGISLGGVDPATLHQTTHAISAEYVSEML